MDLLSAAHFLPAPPSFWVAARRFTTRPRQHKSAGLAVGLTRNLTICATFYACAREGAAPP